MAIIPKIDATRVFQANWNTRKKIVINRGGTRSSKTRSICQQLAIWLLTGQIRNGQSIMKGVASVVRKHKVTLKSTVMRDFTEVLAGMGVMGLIKENKTDRTFSYQGRMVEFFGADDDQKIRGYKANILFCNEANELEFKTQFFQLLVRTTDLVIIDFNPSDEYIWINTEIEQRRAAEKQDVDVIVSTYKDNPFLSKEQIAEIEYLAKTDNDLWQVYGLGQYGKVMGLIYPKYEVVEYFPANVRSLAYGLDFGYTNDPTALLRCGVMNERDLYVDEVIYQTGLTNPGICELMRSAGVSIQSPIWADSSEPKSIAEIKSERFAVRGAVKGPDSVRAGIGLVKTMNLYVTARSTNVIRELMRYKYLTAKDGSSTNTPIDAYNHAMDALRYYAAGELFAYRPKIGKFVNSNRLPNGR